jgi:hypothetical protein
MADKPSLLAQLHPNPKLEKLRNEKIKITTQKEKAEVKLTQSGHRVTQVENEIETDKKKARTARNSCICFKGAHIEYLIPETADLNKEQFMKFCDALFSFPGISAHIQECLRKAKEEET